LIADQATVSGGDDPTGTVTFNLYDNPSGAGTPLFTDTESLSAGTATSAAYTATASGTVYWVATYNGDSNNSRVASGLADEPVTITAAPTSLSTSLSDDSQTGSSINVPSGTTVSDQATLSGVNAALATGTVTYNVYTDDECTQLAAGGAGTAETISTPGVLPASQPVSLSSPGTYYWQAVYSGDDADGGSTSPCGSETETVVAPASTTLTTTLSGGSQTGSSVSVQSGVPVTDQASLSGANVSSAGGTVTYQVYADPLCQTPLFSPMVEPVSGGVPAASLPVYLPTGTYYWTASYSGDGLDDPASEPCGAQTSVWLGLAKYGADVGVTLEVTSGASIEPGWPFPIDLSVTDYGPKAAKSIVTGISLPSGITLLNADGASKLGKLLVWRTGNFAAGQTFLYQLIAETNQSSGTLTVHGGALSLQTLDPNYKNNFVSQAVTLDGGLAGSPRNSPRHSTNRGLFLARLRALGRSARKFR
jgi:hypothetical protein